MLQNNSNIHAGTVRVTPRHRRSIGFDFGHVALSDYSSTNGEFEPRLRAKYPDLLGYLEADPKQRGARL